jgi:ABC-type transport system involved in multi-copper enzyme maturation permease subunit
MTGKIFAETLGRGWKTMLYWGIGMALYSLIITVAVLDDQTLQQMLTLINSLPAFLMQGFMGTADIAFMTTPNGYFATKYFTTAMLIFSAYAILAGMAVTANDEDAGILDSFLSLPIRRWAVIIERGLAHVLMLLGVLVLAFMGVAVGSLLVPHVSYDLGGILVGILNMLPSLLFVLLATIFFGVLFRRRSVALGVSAALVIFSYLIYFVTSGAPDSPIAPLGLLSFYHYYNGVGVMQFGLDLANVGLLLALAAVFAALSLLRFERRDIGL